MVQAKTAEAKNRIVSFRTANARRLLAKREDHTLAASLAKGRLTSGGAGADMPPCYSERFTCMLYCRARASHVILLT